jgi:hypothetical protein
LGTLEAKSKSKSFFIFAIIFCVDALKQRAYSCVLAHQSFGMNIYSSNYHNSANPEESENIGGNDDMWPQK